MSQNLGLTNNLWEIFRTLKQNSTAQVICNLEAVSICRSPHARYVGWWSSLALQPLSDAQIYTWHGHSSSTTGTFGACIFSTTCQSKRWRRAACLGWWEMGTPEANSLTRSRWQERFVRGSAAKRHIVYIYIYTYIYIIFDIYIYTYIICVCVCLFLIPYPVPSPCYRLPLQDRFP